MVKKTTVFLLIFAVVLSLAACQSVSGKNGEMLGEEYPKDVFRIYERASVADFSQKSAENGVETFYVKAISKDNVSDIADYYKVLLKNADTAEQTQNENMFLMKGFFYGYNFSLTVSDNDENKAKTAIVINLEKKAEETEEDKAAVEKDIGTVKEIQIAEEPEEEGEPEANILLNGFSYHLNAPPVWIKGTLWVPGLEILKFIAGNSLDYDTWIGCNIRRNGGSAITYYFGEGDHSYGADGDKYDAELAPIREGGKIYLSQEMINNIFGDVLTCGGIGEMPELNTDSLYLYDAQEQNPHIYRTLKLKSVNELGDTKLSTMVSACCKNPAQDWIGWIDNQKADGFTEIRFALNHIDAIYPNDDYQDYMAVEQDFPDEYKEVFRHAHEKNMTVRYVLTFWDYKNRHEGGSFSINRLDSQGEIDRYIEYVKMTVSELKGLVDRYELWNEPDANYEGHQKIQPQDYINMALQVIPVINETDPEAEVVILGSCGFGSEDEAQYTKTILNSQVPALANGISLHTVNMDAMPQNRSTYYYNYEKMMEELRGLAQANGFEGYIIADELNYRSEYSLTVLQKEDPNFYYGTPPEISAKNIARMMVMNRGMGIWVGMSGTNSFERIIEGRIIHDYNIIMDGLSPAEADIEITSSSDMMKAKIFTDENNNLYLAVWNDIATEVVSGHEKCTISVNGISAESAKWLDPYSTVQKNLVFINGENGTTVENLNIPDYPIFIKINTKD